MRISSNSTYPSFSFCKETFRPQLKVLGSLSLSLTSFRFDSITILLSSLGFAVESFLNDVEDAAHTDGTEEVLEGDEGVGDAEEEGGELEVDEEDDNSEIDEGVGSGYQVGLLVHNEDESCQETRLGGAGKYPISIMTSSMSYKSIGYQYQT